MVKDYFKTLRTKKIGVNKTEIKKTLTRRISKQFELNVVTDNFVKDIDASEMRQQEAEISRKLEVSAAGLRIFEY
jgi:Ni2+-binding GTPase involved in maturation of urease and hydrogenase